MDNIRGLTRDASDRYRQGKQDYLDMKHPQSDDDFYMAGYSDELSDCTQAVLAYSM